MVTLGQIGIDVPTVAAYLSAVGAYPSYQLGAVAVILI